MVELSAAGRVRLMLYVREHPDVETRIIEVTRDSGTDSFWIDIASEKDGFMYDRCFYVLKAQDELEAMFYLRNKMEEYRGIYNGGSFEQPLT